MARGMIFERALSRLGINLGKMARGKRLALRRSNAHSMRPYSIKNLPHPTILELLEAVQVGWKAL